MLRYDLSSFLKGADALIVVPPFAALNRPSLGAHILQACAAAKGFSVEVLYANILLAAEIGELNYESICYAPTPYLVGERFFAQAAYGDEVAEAMCFSLPPRSGSRTNFNVDMNQSVLRRQAKRAGVWADDIADAICRLNYRVVGCTTTFEQTSASLALLNRIKAQSPQVTTIVGGANCEGEMAEGVLSLKARVDFIFSGECETAFPSFLEMIASHRRPPGPIIEGEPCREMDAIPSASFHEYYQQLNAYLPESALVDAALIWLPYETSRGCWWGQKHHCTFCGLNGSTIVHRQKSPNRVLSELKTLLASHPTRKVCMTDNIMPHSYFTTLLPRLGEELPGVQMFYEQKANLSLQQVIELRNAGMAVIQPGIEALSTSFLRRMEKGVTATQNLNLLRYARSVDLMLNWNLLVDFPFDQREEYESTIDILPLLRHLNPPSGVSGLIIDRFSPYFNDPPRYGIKNVKPMGSYKSTFPLHADIYKLAYHFAADYESAGRTYPELIDKMTVAVSEWRRLWNLSDAGPPVLCVVALADDGYMLLDTRGLGINERVRFLTKNEATICLIGYRGPNTDDVEWAVRAGIVVKIDGWFAPLATAEPELMLRFEASRFNRELPLISAWEPSGS